VPTNTKQLLSKKHEIASIFDGDSNIEQFCIKKDSTMFITSSSNKKRPNCLTMGRLFNNNILDLYEILITK